MRLLQRSSVSQPRARKAHGQAWQAAWAGQRRASESREGRAAVLRFRRASGGVEESTAPAFRKTGPDVCCRRSLKWSSCFLLLDDAFYQPVNEATLGSDSIRSA